MGKHETNGKWASPNKDAEQMLAINRASIQRKGQAILEGPRYLAASAYWKTSGAQFSPDESQPVIGRISIPVEGRKTGGQLLLVSFAADGLRTVVSARVGVKHAKPWKIILAEASERPELGGLEFIDYGNGIKDRGLEKAHLSRLGDDLEAYVPATEESVGQFYSDLLAGAIAASQNGARIPRTLSRRVVVF